MKSYYMANTPTTTYVWFKLLDATGKELRNFESQACFSPITYSKIPDGTAVVLVRHRKANVPYGVDEIKRWVADLNEIGFPCSFIEGEIQSACEKRKQFVCATTHVDTQEIAQKLLCHGQEQEEQSQSSEKDWHHFEVKVDDFKYKAHFVGTLMLLRCLTESLICKVPEIYFQMMDENPDADKFEVLQNAHKRLGEYGHNDSWHNTNHMVTYEGNGANITKQKLWARYEKCGLKVLGDGSSRQSDKWNGNLI